MRRHSILSACLNGLVAALIAVLLGFAVKLKIQLVVISEPGDSFSTLSTTPATWNVGVTIVGTVVGILASIAFSAQDAFLSRLGLVSQRGVSAIFLRPLTTMRGFQQLVRGEFNPERTALVILTLGTALTSAATVALLSVQTVIHDETNTSPSFPLAFYNSTDNFDMTDSQGAVIGLDISTATTLILYVNSFIYRCAFINGQAEAPPLPERPYLPEQGLLGQTTYSNLWTSGVGINANSYMSFSGPTANFPLPLNYTFRSLTGRVYGTTVNVTCENRTSSYSVDNLGLVSNGVLVTASKVGLEKGFDTNITMYLPTRVSDILPMGFNLTYTPTTGPVTDADPTHVVLVTDWMGNNAEVFECSYQGREVLVEVAISGPADPLIVGKIVDEGPFIGPAVKELIAQTLNEIIGANGGGSVLSKAFVNAKYNDDGGNTTAEFGNVMGRVLSQAGQAIISVLRQPIEIANLYDPPPSQGAYVTMSFAVQRVGGGNYGWFAVYGAVLLGALIGLFRALFGGNAVAFEAQDAVILLGQTLGDSSMRSTTKVKFVEGVGLIHPSTTKPEGQSDGAFNRANNLEGHSQAKIS